jgi:hypothetical protein
MDVAGCACLFGARFVPVTVSASAGAPAPDPDSESQPAGERERLDTWENEGGASVSTASTGRP